MTSTQQTRRALWQSPSTLGLIGKAILMVLAASCGLRVVTAQPSGKLGLEHQPNAATTTCLENLTQSCAIAAAFETVFAEELGIERAKVLIAVARSLIAAGDAARARQTLLLALEESRSVGLSLVVQDKLRDIAPLLARIGDGAAALDLVGEIRIDSVRDQVLLSIAEQAGKAGDAVTLSAALEAVKNRKRAFWRNLSLLSRYPALMGGEARIESVRPAIDALEFTAEKFRALAYLAAAAHSLEEVSLQARLLREADTLLERVISSRERATAQAEKARALFDVGADLALVRGAYEQAATDGRRLRGDARQGFALRIGVVEAGLGEVSAALERLRFFDTLEEKATYLGSLTRVEDPRSLDPYRKEITDLLGDLTSAFERDSVRILLLEGAVANQDLTAAKDLVLAMEDDDNQAFGLALLAPITG